MLIAYDLCPADLARFDFYEGAPSTVFCPRCGDPVDPDYVPADLGVTRMHQDIVGTGDGHFVVSQKFKDFCVRMALPDLQFERINRAPPLYDLRVKAIVTYDVACGPPRFEKKCPECGRYESVVQPVESCLTGIDLPIMIGLFRTDLEFASGREKHPILVVGLETAELFRKEKLKGALIRKIEKP